MGGAGSQRAAHAAKQPSAMATETTAACLFLPSSNDNFPPPTLPHNHSTLSSFKQSGRSSGRLQPGCCDLAQCYITHMYLGTNGGETKVSSTSRKPLTDQSRSLHELPFIFTVYWKHGCLHKMSERANPRQYKTTDDMIKTNNITAGDS